MKSHRLPTKIPPALLCVIGLGLGCASFTAFAEERTAAVEERTAVAKERTSTVEERSSPVEERTSGTRQPPAIHPPAPLPPAVAEGVIHVEKAPPAAKKEAMPEISTRPFPEAIWVPGYWIWHGGDYVWVPGKWDRPPEGRAVWIAPRWEKRDQGYVFVAGSWK